MGERKIQKKKFSGFLSIILLILTMLSVVCTVQALDFYLTLETNPADVLIVDPTSVIGEGYYASGTCVIVDAKPTVTSGAIVYEFVDWSHHDPWVGEPEDEPVLTDTQNFIFMDSPRTVTAIYEPHYSYYLTLETNPTDVLTIDPTALTGEGLYGSGSLVTIDAKQTIISETVRYEFVAWDTTDTSAFPEEAEDLTGNQALIFMDGTRTVTAIYEEVFVGEWEYSFEDESGEIKLIISTDDKYFQFITPEKTYAVTKADNMIVTRRSTFISHVDDEISLLSFSLNSNIDYCITYVRDMQNGQTYLLIDRIGME